MTKTYQINSFLDVQTLHEQARKCPYTVTVFDSRHSNADAKSILGLMSLVYTDPVRISCETDSFFSALPLQAI